MARGNVTTRTRQKSGSSSIRECGVEQPPPTGQKWIMATANQRLYFAKAQWREGGSFVGQFKAVSIVGQQYWLCVYKQVR